MGFVEIALGGGSLAGCFNTNQEIAMKVKSNVKAGLMKRC